MIRKLEIVRKSWSECSSGQVQCNFESPASYFPPNVRKSFTQNLKRRRHANFLRKNAARWSTAKLLRTFDLPAQFFTKKQKFFAECPQIKIRLKNVHYFFSQSLHCKRKWQFRQTCQKFCTEVWKYKYFAQSPKKSDNQINSAKKLPHGVPLQT